MSGRSETQRHLALPELQVAATVHQVISVSARTAAVGLACTARCSQLVYTASKKVMCVATFASAGPVGSRQVHVSQPGVGTDKRMQASKVLGHFRAVSTCCRC